MFMRIGWRFKATLCSILALVASVVFLGRLPPFNGRSRRLHASAAACVLPAAATDIPALMMRQAPLINSVLIKLEVLESVSPSSIRQLEAASDAITDLAFFVRICDSLHHVDKDQLLHKLTDLADTTDGLRRSQKDLGAVTWATIHM